MFCLPLITYSHSAAVELRRIGLQIDPGIANKNILGPARLPLSSTLSYVTHLICLIFKPFIWSRPISVSRWAKTCFFKENLFVGNLRNMNSYGKRQHYLSIRFYGARYGFPVLYLTDIIFGAVLAICNTATYLFLEH